METECSKCKSKIRVPDHKLPPDKSATVACPRCKNKITLPPRPLPKEDDEDAFFDTQDLDMDEPRDRPFDFIEEEGKMALVCETDQKAQSIFRSALEFMEFRVITAANARDALRNIRYYNYDMIIVNEGFDTRNPDANGVLIYLERLMMSARRHMYVVMISRRFRTMDHMMALRHSVNLIVNVLQLEEFGKILKRGITDHEYFYRRYKEQLREIGSAS